MAPSYSKENLCAEICALNFANGKDVGWALVHLDSIAVAPASCPLRRVRVAVYGCFSYLRHETQIESPIWLHLYRKQTTILENCWIWDGFWGRLAHKTKVLGVVSKFAVKVEATKWALQLKKKISAGNIWSRLHSTRVSDWLTLAGCLGATPKNYCLTMPYQCLTCTQLWCQPNRNTTGVHLCTSTFEETHHWHCFRIHLRQIPLLYPSLMKAQEDGLALYAQFIACGDAAMQDKPSAWHRWTSHAGFVALSIESAHELQPNFVKISANSWRVVFETSLFFGNWAGAWKTIIHSSKNDNICLYTKTWKTIRHSWKLMTWSLGAIYQILTVAHIFDPEDVGQCTFSIF